MRLLVIRFSAMGDVALTVPVVRGVLKSNPNLNITMVSNVKFEPLFHDIDRLDFYKVHLDSVSGISGLYRLYRKLKLHGSWDAVIDLHSVMRTWVLGSFFKLSGTKVFKIDKGRKGKSELVRKDNKVLKQLKHSTERYLNVFNAFGLDGNIEEGAAICVSEKAQQSF